jgi:hypothetical protein
MTITSGALPTEAREQVKSLFESSSPVLVEVRFPNCAVSSDWHLCQDEEEFTQVLESLQRGAEIHLNSVWDLQNGKGALVVRR